MDPRTSLIEQRRACRTGEREGYLFPLCLLELGVFRAGHLRIAAWRGGGSSANTSSETARTTRALMNTAPWSLR
jgi:hypothetical protein